MSEPVVEDAIPVWPDMQVGFALFCDAEWQWVSLGLAGTMRTNIRRDGLEASARLLGLTITPAIFGDIRAMEAEALTYWSRRNK
jgi:hypothetical protein